MIGSWFADNQSIGWMCLHHHDKKYAPHFRRWSLFAAERAPDAEGLEDIVSESFGPIFPLAGLYHSKDQVNFPRLWIPCPPIQEDPKQANRYSVLKTWDDPLKELQTIQPTQYKDILFPNDWPYTILDGVDIDEQIKLLFPGFAGLACAHIDKPADRSTLVWRLQPNGSFDQNIRAFIHDFWYVWNNTPQNKSFPKGTFPKDGGLAWHLDKGPLDSPSRATITDTITGIRKLAHASHAEGGMLSTGRLNDQHNRGRTSDGEEISAAHTNTEQLFIRPNGSGDAPMRDAGQWVPCSPGPFVVPCYWRFDPDDFHRWVGGNGAGLWKDQASTFYGYQKPPEDKPLPPVDQPPRPPTLPRGPVDEPPVIPDTPDEGTVFLPDDPTAQLDTPLFSLNSTMESTDKPRRGFLNPLTVIDFPSAMTELGQTSLVRRASAQFQDLSALDLRNVKAPFDSRDSKEIHETWVQAPNVLREDVIADYTQLFDEFDRRYPAPDAPGAVFQFPANLGAEDVFARPSNLPTVQEVSYAAHQVRWGHATPQEDGKLVNGYSFDTTGDTYEFHHHPSATTGSRFLAFAMRGDHASMGGGYEGTNSFTPFYSAVGVASDVVIYAADQAAKSDLDHQLRAIDAATVASATAIPLGLSIAAVAAGDYGSAIRSGIYHSSLNAAAGAVGDPVYFTSTGVLTLTDTGSRIVGRVMFPEANAWVYLQFPGETPAAGRLSTSKKTASFTAEYDTAYLVAIGAVDITVNLPAISSAHAGRSLIVSDDYTIGANKIILAPNGTDEVDGNGAGNNVNITAAGTSVRLLAFLDGANGKWLVV